MTATVPPAAARHRVTLSAMAAAELSARLVGQVDDYAEDLVRSGLATPDDAPERSRIAYATLLPDGVRTEGHLVRTAHVDGVTVGWIWLALPGNSPVRPDLSWIFDVEIDPPHRGKGHGRGILLAAERELAARGLARIGLNVFGHNAVARHLYESLGYEVTARQLVKTLAPAGSPAPAISLRPMTERELRAWIADQTGELAAQMVNAGEASPQDAPEAARSLVAARLPDGVATPGQLVYAGEIDGVTVARIWAALPGSGGQQRPGTAWIYYVHVEPANRGHGHGRAIIEALSTALAARGIPRLGLNVYGHNTAAGRLYDSLGFEVTAQQMVKSLD